MWSHQSYTGVAPVCNLEGHFTHGRGGGAEWEPREHEGAPWFWGLGVFSQMIFLAGEHRIGSGWLICSVWDEKSLVCCGNDL